MSELKQLCIELEHFETPEWAVKAILCKEILTRVVVDPCAGTGILVFAAAEAGYAVHAADIHDWKVPDFNPAIVNWLCPYGLGTWEWLWDKEDFTVFMNPPFSKATQFVEKAFELGARKVVCFQRFAWWESQGRRDFWQKYPPNRIYICGDRAHCWRHDIPHDQRGSSSPTAHAWFVWEKGHPAGTQLSHIYKSETEAP